MPQGESLTPPVEDLQFFERFRRDLYYPEATFESTLGLRVPIIYADATAMGSPLRCIEREVEELLLPGDVEAIDRAYQETLAELGRTMNAGDEYDFIGVGTGCTGALNLLFREILAFRYPDYLEGKGLPEAIPEEERPVFITSLMEHHSADLVLRESFGRETIHLGFDQGGTPDAEELRGHLELHARQEDRPVYVVLSGGSNVTGIQPDLDRLAAIAREYGAFLAFDFAAGGPYSKIDLRALGADAIGLSPHKFPGGPGTCGVLALRRRHLEENLYRPPELTLSAKIEMIRVGRVLRLKAEMNVERIRRVVSFYSRLALARLAENPLIQILGHTDISRFAIISLVVRAPYGPEEPTPEEHQPFVLERAHPDGRLDRYVHHNFVARLLSDRFGAQVRPGCSCAGAYGHWLLQIDPELSEYHRDRIDRGLLDKKPGWVRVTFNEMNTLPEVETVLSAVHTVARDWQRFTGEYRIDSASGEFVRQGHQLAPVGVEEFAELGDPDPASGYSPAIEGFIQREILPSAANTHTETSYTGTVSTMWYHWAHETIRERLGTPEDGVLKFVRAGYDPERLLIYYLGGAIPPLLKARYSLKLTVPPQQRPVFFLCGRDGRALRPMCFGVIHRVAHVEELLRSLRPYESNPKFALLSCLEGQSGAEIAEDTRRLQQAGCRVVAEVTPLVGREPIRMADWGLDGLVVRTEELPGGWQTHPVLMLREEMFQNRLPLDVGGGVVHWTTDQSQRYVADRTALEDAGTPGIIQGIRTGLVIARADESR